MPYPSRGVIDPEAAVAEDTQTHPATRAPSLNQRRPRICVVTPCFNEEEAIVYFYKAIKEVLNALPEYDHHILTVDDGSSDRTLEVLNGLAEKDPCLRVYSLSRNFGHQVALSAGLDAARGDAIIMMDSDLQHPPTLIPQMVALWREGNDIVSAVRDHTEGVSFLKRMTSDGFYWVINKLGDTRMVTGAADFCLLSRKAHLALLTMPERHRFLRGLVSWMGFKRAFIHFQAPRRVAGTSKYTVWKMLRLALDAVFSFSTTPIRAAARLGLIVVVLSFVYLLYVLMLHILGKHVEPGWSSTMFVVLLLGGIQLAFIGVIGQYIARVFEEVKARPLYLLKQKPRRVKPRNPSNTAGETGQTKE